MDKASKHHHASKQPTPRRLSGQTIFLGAMMAASAVVLGYIAIDTQGLAGDRHARTRNLTLAEIPFDGARAYEYLQQVCAIGPRQSGSAGMQEQQKLLVRHFQELGATVRLQEFRARHPVTGAAVPIANLIAQWHPERKERILLCAHYDTRPFPDRDRNDPQGTFIGANDGGSGVAVLMEMARHMPGLPGRCGVDFVLFDAEELVFNERDPYFIGSEYFARTYISQPPPYRYRKAVLLDMVGDANLQLYQERNSIGWRDTRPMVNEIWATASRLGVKEFTPRKGQTVRDDHLMLHDIAKIPACDIIDFEYPHWHTTGDTPDKCSALSLAKVGWVVLEWLKTEVNKP